MADKVPMVEVTPRELRNILRVPQRKGFVRRLVLNDPSRIEEMEDLGYKLVEDKERGGPLTRREYVVMEMPADLYEARQQAKVEANRATRESLLDRAARTELEGQARQGAMRGKAQVIGDVELERL
ncbi:MAG: hypothetical protein QN162_14620 [Armatimonadota bacterium]|nr:hypothetical protein [Armatimonadota bacterium]